MFHLLAAVIYLFELFVSSTITVFLTAEFVNITGIQTEFVFSPSARRLPHITYVNRTATAPTTLTVPNKQCVARAERTVTK